MPHWLGLTTDSLSIAILGILSLSIVLVVKYFLKTTPQNLLVSFNEKSESSKKNTKKPSFLTGLKFIFQHKYLMSIFAVNFIYELIITIFDFNFKLAAGTLYQGVALSNYLSFYSSSVNIVSLLCLILGISNVTRFLGIGVALTAMPLIFGAALFSFLSFDSLPFLFTLMVGSKAINYALNGPALKQLYIPTTTDVRFKAQAWIETFGSRTSKEVGSLFNMLLNPFQSIFGMIAGKANYIILSGLVGFPLLALWFFVTLYLGRKFTKAIDEKKTIC
ncbi:MAG: Npt1/Npt2 family nucleotide transporter [Janthinobacterium lividum]